MYVCVNLQDSTENHAVTGIPVKVLLQFLNNHLFLVAALHWLLYYALA